MKKTAILFLILAVACAPAIDDSTEEGRWQRRAQDVTIIRDDWGIAHVYGKTDADAVFGAIYAQAEDDFNRIETNYLNSMGRLAEAEGEGEIWRDLRMKLFIDPDSLQAMYGRSPEWLRSLMDAFADGLNYYLHTHPEVKPRVITRFEPWMALSFTEGSIGGDIERVNLGQLEAFYGSQGGMGVAVTTSRTNEEPAVGVASVDEATATIAGADDAADPELLAELLAEPAGSNGIAIAPSNTTAGKSLLLINPHTSFFFRSELQMVSEEGLHAYGASTWGQFFIYQGFNERVGWMHTSSNVDNIDEFLETISRRGDSVFYKYGAEERAVFIDTVAVPYRTDAGMASRDFIIYRTHHGPVVREQDGRWVSVGLMEDPINALTQSYIRTKAKSYAEYTESMELHTNSSNNTVYADADGNIAYLHSNFIPRRSNDFDYTSPVDGSNPATDWNGVLAVSETPNVFNPPNGWLQNTNNHPWSAAGVNSPKKADYPVYVESGGENARGLHAMMVLEGRHDFTLDGLVETAFDSRLPWFDEPVPALVRAWDQAPASNQLKAQLAEQVALLRDWDVRWGESSIPTSLAIFWGEELNRALGAGARRAGMAVEHYAANGASGQQLLQALAAASQRLTADFGTWQTPWGEINRFQRLTGDIVHPFDDAGPSIPVAFASGRYGSLASFGARAYPNTKKWYGTSGNSFVAVVEFGDSVRARAVTAGGESGHPGNAHFNDQAERYATGNLREVYFYRSQVQAHAEREYHPGKPGTT